jgi:hypothetical protein
MLRSALCTQILPGMVVGLCQEMPSDCAEGHGGCLGSSCLCGLACCDLVGCLPHSGMGGLGGRSRLKGGL